MQLDDRILNEIEANIKEYNEEEIKEILKKRGYYNPKVVQMALEEAIKRRIINTENDLIAEEYRVEPLRFSLFPKIEKKEIKSKLIKSLARIVLLTGIIPLIFGFLRISENKKPEAFLLVSMGGAWIISAAFLMQTRQNRFLNYILAMVVLSVIYVINYLLKSNSFRFMDFFVALTIYGMVCYSLFYLKILIRK